MRANILLYAVVAVATCLNAQTPTPIAKPGDKAAPKVALRSEISAALASIRPGELKGDLSFLASDLLEGRYTPSRGLDIAAEFIASRFRAMGLEPAAPDYFQLARMIDRKLPKVVMPMVCKQGGNSPTITVEPSEIKVVKNTAAAHFVDAPVLTVSERNPEKLKGLELDGKVILVPMPDFATIPASDRMRVYRQAKAFDLAVAASKALLQVVVLKVPGATPSSRLLTAEEGMAPSPPVIQVASPELAAALKTSAPLTLSLEIPAPQDQTVIVKNVIGVLRGSDPLLKSTCVLLTAHYDHIGTTDNQGSFSSSLAGGKDTIFNGANDDGSGTVSVIEIAHALSQLRPKRSIVFMTFFGEERGLLGSAYYSLHPLFPLAQTIADINLEQLGRTDSSEGPEIANASITGYDYSDVTGYLEDAGKATGIAIYKDETGSDDYFVRSDNAALAEQGVPAHTLTTAFEYPDYHGLGDEWQKIDYDNMAKVDRAVALAVFNLANARKAPAWSVENPKTAPFREAQKHQSKSKQSE